MRILSLGDLKPSDILEQARSAVSRDDMSDAVLCEILMMKLPTEVQITLSIILGSPLNEIAAAAAADTAMPHFSAPVISSINSSTSPFSQNNHDVQQLKFEMPHNLPHSSSISHNRPRHNFIPSRDFGRNKFRSYKPGFYRGPNRLCIYHARFGKNARKCVDPCNWKQGKLKRRSDMNKTALTTTSVQGSHLLHVKDLILNDFFLIDSGAEISIVKPTPSEKRSKARTQLISVDGFPMSPYGNRTLDLCFGGVSKFRWILVIADVKHNILGIDFLRYFSLTIDFTNSKLKESFVAVFIPTCY